MKTTALRLYGKRDLRLETFDLPEMQEDEILATVVTDSLCLSSWKEANLGENHKKVPDDVATNPIIIGHEFCGDILAVGKKWQHKFQPGQRYVIQANLQLPDRPTAPATPSRGWAVKPHMWLSQMRLWNKIACWHTTAKPILKARWLNRFPA